MLSHLSCLLFFFFFSSRRRHTRFDCDWSSDVCSSDLVACDATPSLLFMNNHDGTFREEGLLRGVALNDDGLAQAGMGVAVGDYDVDGHLDIFKTHFADDRNIL